MDNLCTTCQAPLTHVPAGFSQKTQRNYNEFWACPNKHKQLPPRAATPSYQNPPSSSSFERGLNDDSRQNSIIRQHSQTTAIMALELMFKASPEEVQAEILSKGLITTIKAYTDMFDADAKSTRDQ